MTCALCFLKLLFACASACAPGWREFQVNCYRLVPYPIELNGTVLESRWGCLKLGADLVTIKTEEEQTFIEDMLTVSQDGVPVVTLGVYIAAGDGPTEGLFQWFDGSLIGEGKKWYPRNPNNNGPGGIDENCVRVKSGYNIKTNAIVTRNIGTWIDVPCLEPNTKIDSFLCQKPNIESDSSQSREHSFRTMKRRFFHGHHIGQYRVSSLFRCLTMCLASYSCLSANYRPIDSGSENCVLNNATLWEDRDAMLKDNISLEGINPREWNYYEVKYPAFR